MDKQNIRMRIKARKALLSDNEKTLAAERVFNMLEQSAAFAIAENILMYHSLPDELPTHSFLDKWTERKHFFLPRVNGVNLDILPYHKSRLAAGAFQIEEPQGDDITPIEAIDLVIVPAIAYDRHGNRVGRGKGYYDRLLSNSGATKIGVVYDFQLLDDDIQIDSTDVAVDVVITESRRIVIRKK